MKNFAYDIVRVNNKDMLSTFDYGEPVIVKRSFNHYNTNDVIYFQHPLVDSALSKTFMIQRLFGLPGDTIQIINKDVFINGVKIEDTVTIKHNYYIKSISKLDSVFKTSFELSEGGEISDAFDYSYSLTKYQSDNLRAHPYIVSVEIKGEKPNTYDEACFPYSTKYAWNSDYYGKLYIPKINDTLLLDSNNIEIYSNIIREHEKNILDVRGDSIMINGELTHKYAVKKDYYFVLGDNRGNANDSRNWGYLPANLIRGKVIRSLRTKQ